MLKRKRTFDGSFNNPDLSKKYWGASNSELLRKLSPNYADGIDEISENRNVRMISNDLIQMKKGFEEFEQKINLLFPYFTEFVSHDIAFTPSQ